jgi:hypothetical protein
MEWYWWLLIAIGVLALGGVKLFLFKKSKEKRNKKNDEGD